MNLRVLDGQRKGNATINGPRAGRVFVNQVVTLLMSKQLVPYGNAATASTKKRIQGT
jgi:hypothetical protein